ncbi:biogenesis of lysosome-related organelles complex 1 subunit 6 isoform X1 [Hyla sarda]|uniref:biogenesis of lysosome-related organelles complex 1 subunit 6 isoform X1 n=1 Tax=Hyla sarda TaxID=327740 RepID=UPI0024C36197|nr:biogenesis of lysosome-related organelles complex 1 subunit 6 isoform X1 [Hyla sarda]XP_056428199.1 biogenesis of lysosome-related organelles complex 1 subunit 6 isoform X1 [Hyla sarda]
MEEGGKSHVPAVDSNTSSPGHHVAAAGENIEVIDEGLPDDLPSLDSGAVEQLSEGLISHYLPSLQDSKLALQELTHWVKISRFTTDQEFRTKKCYMSKNFYQAILPCRQNQVVLLDTLEQEISKFRECNSILDINALFSEAKYYHNKLVNIRKEMILLHEKTSKLKKRALKLQQKKQEENLKQEQQRERELEREKQLTAKPAKRT